MFTALGRLKFKLLLNEVFSNGGYRRYCGSLFVQQRQSNWYGQFTVLSQALVFPGIG